MLKEITNIGLIVDSIIPDGRFKRVKSANSKGLPGWYVAKELNGRLIGAFGNWSTGEKYKYPGNGAASGLSDAEREEIAVLSMIARKEEEQAQKKAATLAKKIWDKSSACPSDHPYLAKKQIKPHSARLEEKTGALIISLIDPSGAISTLQRIFPDGKKLQLKNGKKKGCCHIIEGDSDIVYICEGFATGATINEATGKKVLVALDAGNLIPVAENARRIISGKIIIAADNDYTKEVNTGIQFGKKAAEKINSFMVYPEGIKGSDFNDMANELGVNYVKAVLERDTSIKIITREQLSTKNNTLLIDKSILYPGGLINLGIDGLKEPGMPCIDQYSFPVVAAVIANAIAGKIICNGVWPNVYNIKIGPTSSGKSVSDKEVRIAIKSADIKHFYGITDTSSGPGLYRALSENPRTIFVLDEVTALFRRSGKNDPIADGKRDALLDIYSSSGMEIRKTYSNKKDKIEIDNPCLTLTGNATPLVIDAFMLDDLKSGLIQRFDFFCYDGDIPKKGVLTSENKKLKEFATGIKKLAEVNVYEEGSIAALINHPIDIHCHEPAVRVLQDYSDYIIDRCNKANEESGHRGIISRAYDLAIKYAMIHIASVRPPEEIKNPVEVSNLMWGIQVAEMLSSWKIKTMTEKISSGEFDRQCKIFKSAIEVATKYGRRPTFKYLQTRKREMSNWTKKESGEVIDILKKRGDIFIDESQKNTAYFLIDKEENDEK